MLLLPAGAGLVTTLVGISSVFAGFSDYVSGVADLEQIKMVWGDIALGLGVALDPLALGLCVALGGLFLLSFVDCEK